MTFVGYTKQPAVIVSFGLVAIPTVFCLTQAISSRPGYESSLILSPFLALACGTAALWAVRREIGRAGSLRDLVMPAAVLCMLLLAVPLLALLLGAAFRGACDLADGLGFFLLGPAVSALAGASAGLIVAASVGRTARAWLLWASIPLLFLASDFLGFYATVKVNVYDHLLGYFAGPLWDEAVSVDRRLWIFRGVTLANLLAIHAVFFSGLDESRTFSARSLLSRRRGVAALAFLGAVLLGSYFAQVHSGISGSRRLVESRLSKVIRTGSMVMYLPEGRDESEVQWLEREAAFRASQLERFFGGRPEGTLRLYFFPSSSTMKKFTGTGPTSVAKLWLGEAYMVFEPSPHDVLKHELAHLYAAQWGRGPLLLPGGLWGLRSDPVILEGTAVAAEWPGEPADPHHCVAASIKAGMLENWNPFSSLGFFKANKGLSYLASGSFVRFVRDMWGIEGLKAWYGGKPFEEALGLKREDAVRMWRQFMASIEVPDELVAEMKQRYAAPSIFERRCPHAVANLYVKAGACMDEGRMDCALETLDSIAAVDPDNPVHGLTAITWLSSRCMAAREHIGQLLGNRELVESKPLKVYGLCGDIAWTVGDREKSMECYGQALDRAYDDYSRRLLAIKMWAAAQEGTLSERYREYLVCDRYGSASSFADRLAVLLTAVLDQPDLGLTHYLIARNLYNAGSFEAAARYLEESLALADLDPEAPLPVQEAELLLAECLLKIPSRRDEALPMLAQLAGRPGLSPAMTHRIGDLQELARFLGSAAE